MGAPVGLDASELPTPPPEHAALELVRVLCGQLDEHRIEYCHWKSNDALDRSASGENDLDLLVRRSHGRAFFELVHRLGFKPARAPRLAEMPGVVDYYGLDEVSGRLVHLHVHFQLVVGDDRTKNYRLPLADALLDSATHGALFRTPAPELEFVVFVIRMILKHSVWDAMLEGFGRLKEAERRELAHLRSRLEPAKLAEAVERHAAFVGRSVFDDCVEALDPGAGWWHRIRSGARLQWALRAHTRRVSATDLALKATRRLELGVRRRTGRIPRSRLAGGGAMIAVVGSDGSGKTTAIDAMVSWLAPSFELRRLHLGRPSWSLSTRIARACLKLARVVRRRPYVTTASVRYAAPGSAPGHPGYGVLVRELCAGRDRRLAFARARRFANTGGLVLCDRFPSSALTTMDGPQIEHLVAPEARTRLVDWMIALERRCYEPITAPDCAIVLRLEPELALARKSEDDPASVRARADEIWKRDWSDQRLIVVNAAQPREEVLSRVKRIVWQEL